MASPYFYLYDGTNTLSLDDNVSEVTFGGTKRNFEVVNFATANGGVIRGIGNYDPKIFKVVHTEKIESGDVNAWNSRRNDFMIFFTKPVYQNLWLYLQNGEQTMTLRTQVYCTKIPDDKFETLLMAKEREFELISPSGIWEKTTATTANVTITSANEQSFSIVNNSTIEIVPTFSFTPDTLCDTIQLKTAEGFGWRLEGSFSLGVVISFDMKTGILTNGGASVDLANYMTAGSPFALPRGTNTLYFKASTSGTLSYLFYERYI